MTLEQVVQSYMSWRGSMLQRDAYRSVLSMDQLFFDLFGETPWKKKKKSKWRKNHEYYPRFYSGRNYCPENAVG